ncbi:hypothetical protein ABH931_000688 [Streptacidiphilus sp. MAP12-33]|uniref:hypothetical protein n=1 Tax=Streptacidiphilus sp. MAP12-33 TaxID=3156266 RepID=UPI0035189594
MQLGTVLSLPKRAIKWCDHHLWLMPFFVFLFFEVVMISLRRFAHWRGLLEHSEPDVRQQVYSSLTGSSSGLLGFALAAVAILAVFGQRSVEGQAAKRREEDLANARMNVIGTFLSSSLMLLIVLVVSTIGIAADSKRYGNLVISNLAFCAACSAAIGLLLGGLGMGLAVLERNRADRAQT